MTIKKREHRVDNIDGADNTRLTVDGKKIIYDETITIHSADIPNPISPGIPKKPYEAFWFSMGEQSDTFKYLGTVPSTKVSVDAFSGVALAEIDPSGGQIQVHSLEAQVLVGLYNLQ